MKYVTRKIQLLVIITYICSSIIYSQQKYLFSEFKDIENLSSNIANDFYQDSFGFLWIATADGLNRYDGRNVKFYKNRQGDDTTIPDNETHVVLEDSENNIWVGCFNSIAKLNRKTEKFKRYSLDHLQQKDFANFFTALLDKKGNIWFGNSQHGVLRFNKATEQFDQIRIDDSNGNKVWGEVHKIIELKNGAILAADYNNGLLKYNKDKDQFERYNLKQGYNPKGINTIYEDSRGNIWFGGGKLLIKYSPSQYIVKQIELLKYSKIKTNYHNITGIVEDNSGDMWISSISHGLFKINYSDDTPQQFAFNKTLSRVITNKPNSNIYKDKYGVIWLSYRGGGISKLNTQTEPFSFTPLNILRDNQLISTTVTEIQNSGINKNEIILGTSSEGIFSLNLETQLTKNLIPNYAESKRDSTINIKGLIVDMKGDIWYSQNEKWIQKLSSKHKLTSFDNPHIKKTTSPLDIASINYSPHGNIWICSNSGIDKYMPDIDSLYSLPRIMNKPIDPILKSSVSQIIENRIPVASILKVGEGTNIEKEFEIKEKQKLLLVSVGEGREFVNMYDFGSLLTNDGNIIWTMNDLEKSFYSGGGYKNRISVGCLELNPGKYKLKFTSDVGHSYGDWNTIVPADSNWWGIQAFAISDSEYEKIDALNKKGIENKKYIPFESGRNVEFSKKYSNNIWIGTRTHSFFRYDLSSGNYRNYNFDSVNISSTTNFIFCIYEDMDGIVWVGTYSSLIRLDPESETLNKFTTDDGLPGGLIYSVVEDNNGALWINTSGGLSKLNKNAPIDKYAFINYDSRDGLKGNIQTNAVWKNENGRLFFGGKNGVISFKPGKINQVKPDVVIHDMKIKEISIFDDSSSVTLDSTILIKKEINLDYFQNDISFDFSVIHFTRPQKNKISYKLEGYNKGWTESNRNYASFTNLDPGEYVFRVKGSNGDGIWNEDGRSIRIIINPPWWKTTVAYIGYGVFFLSTLFGVDRLQRKRLLSKAKVRMKFQEAEHRAETAELQAKATEAQSKLIQIENERKTKELEEARQLQLSMLPKELPNLQNLDIAVYMQTATEVGGDYYDFHVGIDGTLTVVIGDATGHGLNAGTIVTATKSLFNSYAPNPDILFTFSEISRCIKGLKFRRLSMCLALLKIEGNKLKMSSAGMPPALIYREEKKELEEIMLKGMPLGTTNKFPYELRETTLGAGDTILLSSDGFPELLNEKKEMFGYERMKETFTEIADRSSEKIITHLKGTAKDWVNGKDPDDDVTFVVIKVK
ncbi:hypothetical protein MNBD_IGNAVI01-1125 [hydrothermal vent metagenome]|uniref:PPM-type phosphatase domain-containing protein n=1 Tax=hydrothermal vent metagenome TaxID=652676 RepID=A0A3B1CTT5_9ZZZZ